MTTTTSLSELTGDYVLDTAHTRIGFVARHTMATKVRGQFGEFEGSAHLDGDDPPKLSAQLTITAKSIQTRNQHRDEALRSKFLDTGNYPAITFTSTKVEQTGDTNFTVTGDLTIRGVTKPVTVDFKLTGAKTDPWGNFRVGSSYPKKAREVPPAAGVRSLGVSRTGSPGRRHPMGGLARH